MSQAERNDPMARSGPDTSGGTAPGPGAPVVIDCDDCAAARIWMPRLCGQRAHRGTGKPVA